MADGSYKNIEDVVVGDIVKTENGNNSVVELDHTTLGDRLLYSFNDDNNYFVTAEHPFMTRDGWKSIDPAATKREREDLYRELVGTLSVGDEIKTTSGEYIEITQILSQSEDDQPLYNFHVENDPSYFANKLLVHNKTVIQFPDPSGGDQSAGGTIVRCSGYPGGMGNPQYLAMTSYGGSDDPLNSIM